MTSLNMNNSIYDNQNEEFLLECLVAQKDQYSHVKKINFIKWVITLSFTILSIIVVIFNIDIVASLLNLFSIVLLIFNKYTDKYIVFCKKRIASIQQYVDVTLFSKALGGNKSEWGELPNDSELAEMVYGFSGVDTSCVKNWYDDYSSLPKERQVFYCQLENVRWDYNLFLSYRNFQVGIFIIFLFIIFIYFVVTNPSFFKIIYILSLVIPFAEYTFVIYKGYSNSFSLLVKINFFCKKIEKILSEDSNKSVKQHLIKLQYKIRERRENGVLIPDWFYKIKKNEYQKKERSIAKSINNLNTKNSK